MAEPATTDPGSHATPPSCAVAVGVWLTLTALLALPTHLSAAADLAPTLALAAPALWALLPALALAHGGAAWLGVARPRPTSRAVVEAAFLLAFLAVAARQAPAVPVPCTAAALAFQALAVAPAEEAFFRGWLQAGLRAAWGPTPAVCGAALAFGVTHVAVRADLAALGTALPGLLFGLVRERHASLVTPWLLHATANVALLAWHAPG